MPPHPILATSKNLRRPIILNLGLSKRKKIARKAADWLPQAAGEVLDFAHPGNNCLSLTVQNQDAANFDLAA
jgi:hypothetical protein